MPNTLPQYQWHRSKCQIHPSKYQIHWPKYWIRSKVIASDVSVLIISQEVKGQPPSIHNRDLCLMKQTEILEWYHFFQGGKQTFGQVTPMLKKWLCWQIFHTTITDYLTGPWRTIWKWFHFLTVAHCRPCWKFQLILISTKRKCLTNKFHCKLKWVLQQRNVY